MDNFIKNEQNMIVNKNKIKSKNVIIIAVIIIFAIITSLYISNENFRKYIDRNILKKEVQDIDTKKIYVSSINPSRVIVSDNNIYLLRNGEMSIYDRKGQEKKKDKVSVGTPLYKVSGKYLALGDRESTSIYLYEDETAKWERKLEMPVLSISVNSEGYVSVVTKDSIYKSVVIVFDKSGKQIFKTYISQGYTIDTDISRDNNFLAIAEIDYSKTIANSNVKIISIPKAKTDPKNAIVNEFMINKLIVNIKFKENRDLIAQYSDSIYNISLENNNNTREIYKLEGNVEYVDIENRSGIAIIKKENSGIFANKYNLINLTEGGKEASISLIGEAPPRNVVISDGYIGINDGKEIKIYTSSHWYKKKYVATKEIKDFKLSDKMVVIIYQDKLEILEL